MDRLQEILDTMDVPKGRRTDLGWLSRNLRIRNGGHPNIDEAITLINQLKGN